MGLLGSTWVYFGLLGSTWVYLGLFGPTVVNLGLPIHQWRPLEGSQIVLVEESFGPFWTPPPPTPPGPEILLPAIPPLSI